MNGKFNHEETPEGRLAAVAVMVAEKIEDNFIKTGVGPMKPDVADLREAMRPFMLRELIMARLDEADKALNLRAERRADLVRQLYVCEAQIPKELRP